MELHADEGGGYGRRVGGNLGHPGGRRHRQAAPEEEEAATIVEEEEDEVVEASMEPMLSGRARMCLHILLG